MSNFFINRPIFAWVVAILITLCGTITMLNLGVESYPNIVPPQILVTATYNGASADAAEKTVAQVLEQNLTGLDHLLYFQTVSSSNGRVQITLTFDTGTDQDIAQVQVQNKVTQANNLLPAEVSAVGITVQKASAGFLMFIGVVSDDPTIDRNHLNDIIASQVLEQVGRINGVGSYQQFGSEYAMHIWLDPIKLQGYSLSTTDVYNAVSAQNQQFAAGNIGGDPAPQGQEFTAVVNGEGRLSTPEQFGNIILRSDSKGTVVHLRDVARIAFGPYTYGFDSNYDNQPTGGFGIQLLTGANALNVAKAVRAKMDELQKSFPPGVHWIAPYDSTTFITLSIEDVIHTLVEAIILVFLVMLIFLQNFRATIIPTIVIPVALLGTFIGLAALGFTINQLSLFGMVLAIGIVVDDAIVVIENVERIMEEEHLPPKAATRKAMSEITGAIVGITVVLSAVFIPSGMQSGAAGLIYKEFAFTIAISMLFSAFLALSFTPALCATMLKEKDHNRKPNAFARHFNSGFDKVTGFYQRRVRAASGQAPFWMVIYVLLTLACGYIYTRVPTGFLPEEDQGVVPMIMTLPPGASLQRTIAVQHKIYDIVKHDPAVHGMFSIGGFSFAGLGENVGMSFMQLKPYEERTATAFDVIKRVQAEVNKQVPEAQIRVINLPTVQGLAQYTGADFYLEDQGNQGHAALMRAMGQLMAETAKDKTFGVMFPNTLPPAPQLNLSVDRVQAQSMGLSVSDVYSALQMMLATTYVNQFYYQGRVKRVMIQADEQFRRNTDSFKYFYTPRDTSAIANYASTSDQQSAATNGGNVALSNVVKKQWIYDSPALIRFNGYEGIELIATSAPGYSTGQAMQEMQKLVAKLPRGFGIEWAGESYQEILAGNSATMLMVLSVLIVFLALAALYESWSIPVAVLLVLPIGILGAAAATMFRGLENDLYFKIGMVTVMGLSAKNAILIIEFAVALQREGKTLREAVIEAARLRLRPIVMTSLAFILGVFPMAISSGAGASARHSLGTGVVGGMMLSTLVGLLLIPVFYTVVRRLLGDKLDEVSVNMLAHDDDGKPINPPKPKDDGGVATFDSDPRRGL
ncbi:multidrug efflux RND transporter permease subunit [Frateuria aurantia]|uniref:Efflux pump membrane transporter n=1 Tax=Frateuria aurantia (strain ATCC 33424 / DSM 6220 / KCTC 2777 / LMG 1558 / NBRC 3245 / NCIMB 13370) TaxID=767434 RepID=H8L0W1_FRAAD|nr:multidrug efflux RND transporter permease subunit [Frateuria aurantia]AFC86281.1 hydrophobe/amphiphile efflux-1 (HAE1) family transporter [Frateuria aurantia DSM 6220]